ncbi:uncharacterized protein DNG_00589 [Cephalotrichum gorgonifer]|uniref:BZIP domain-containing protein n=1 Tax=Cephalotrichum gorgonifer TaxID=2041049 RepID=A0AAE8SRD0_9PEZI|nr:uncharacterized protein DNG_00589 [Cephalotrichum gorgonifer]
MVSDYQMHQLFSPTSLALDTSQKYNSDDSVFDNANLDSGLEMSPHMADSRRESFAVGPSLFSPKAEAWESVDMQSIPSTTGYSEHPNSNNPFFRLDQTQGSTPFTSQATQWAFGNGSGTCTPMPPFDSLSDFDAKTSIFQRPMPASVPFSNPNMNMFAGLNNSAQASSASVGPTTSATAGQAVSSLPRTDLAGHGQKKLPPSPTVRSHNDLRRGDGIRKKNARFEIPPDRNLSNIDQLISQSTDEQEVKELKQQKRLLRNRQAALDSRQRKKLHTERLEDEKKQYTTLVSDMEDEINGLKARVEQLLRERQSYQECVEAMTLEKEELIRTHTIETGELRKKVGVLTDHIRRVDGSDSLARADPTAHDFHAVLEPMAGMSMANDWNNLGYINNFGVEQSVKHEDIEMLPSKKSDAALVTEQDKSTAQGGLLFMLFLVGAFVMSNRSASNLPQVSEDVREASANILESVLKDAGVSSTTMGVEAMAPQPSVTASWDNMGGMTFGNANMGSSMLGDLADSLTQPTQEQANEQLFSMTPAQFNGVNSQEFIHVVPDRTASRGRRNLAEALSSMRAGRQSAADVYTRSLLWDQIPSEVVRSFVKMVSDSNHAQGELNPMAS